jgi:hypothetical protein
MSPNESNILLPLTLYAYRLPLAAYCLLLFKADILRMRKARLKDNVRRYLEVK